MSNGDHASREKRAPSLPPVGPALKGTFGISSFRGQQREIIEHVLRGGDGLVLMPTGGGKSLCYQLPAMMLGGTTIVVSPLISLMQNQVAALKRHTHIQAVALNSLVTGDDETRLDQEIRSDRYELVYVSPERVLKPRFLDLLKFLARARRLALFAIDEAHCISSWGHQFRPDYRKLSVLRDHFPDVPCIALTATADRNTREDIVTNLRLQAGRVFVSSFDRPNICYNVVGKTRARSQLLSFINAKHLGRSGIVYCATQRAVEQTAQYLSQNGVRALPYHADMTGSDKCCNQEQFEQANDVVMVATVAFGMGIDKADVRFVAHVDLPSSIEAYYQETGRAGRDGLPADAWLAYARSDVVQLRCYIDDEEDQAQQRIRRFRLAAMRRFCESSQCRRQKLLGYFEEKSVRCGNCDICLDAPGAFKDAEGQHYGANPGGPRPVWHAPPKATFGGHRFVLWERLREWRRQTAQAHGVPEYKVVDDTTLLILASARPQSLPAVEAILGARSDVRKHAPSILRMLGR